MPVAKSKKDVLTAYRCGEILDAATRVFASKGFHGATIEDVARAAGIAKGTIYLYYASKQDVYIQALRHNLLELNRKLAAEVESESTGRGKLEAFLRSGFELLDRNRDFFRIYFVELERSLLREPQEASALNDLYLDRVAVVRGILERGIERGEVAVDRPDAVAYAIVDLVRGIIRQRLSKTWESTIEEDVALLLDLIWQGVHAS